MEDDEGGDDVRMWSVHPRYLDRQGLTSGWREGLLAQAVLAGRTAGYTQHPQMNRFRATSDPLGAIGAYLAAMHADAVERGYRYDAALIEHPPTADEWWGAIEVTDDQVAWEWAHLLAKLQGRSPDVARRWAGLGAGQVALHPLFVRVPGPVADWEPRALAEQASGR